MNEKLSIQAAINNIEHLLKIVLKNQEQMKKHLWTDKEGDNRLKEPLDNSVRNKIDYEEEQAVNYIQSIVIPDLAVKEAEKGDMVAQSAWIEWAARPVIEYLKSQALIWIGKALEELKNQLIPLAIDIADYVLDQLENLLLNQYQKADKAQKEIFKEKIQEKFPNSRLLTKLT